MTTSQDQNINWRNVPTRTITADGVEFASAWERREEGNLEGARVYFIGREDLLKSKRAADRDRDRDDIKTLERRGPPRRPGD